MAMKASDAKPKLKINFEGKKVNAVEVDFDVKSEPWMEIKTKEGTVIKIRPTIVKVLRLEAYDPITGEPTYLVQSHNQLQTKDVPKDVRK